MVWNVTAFMNSTDKALYHQIHPAKLVVDVSTALISLYFFWQREVLSGLLVGIVPSLIASFVIIAFANLEKYQRSPLGRYLAKYMTRWMQGLRLLGQFVAWIGAWYHLVWLIAAGLFMILLGWARGRIFRN